ncbi:hypothetical protein U1Q18_002559 [Sarracenia purpurea var. burkii]
MGPAALGASLGGGLSSTCSWPQYYCCCRYRLSVLYDHAVTVSCYWCMLVELPALQETQGLEDGPGCWLDGSTKRGSGVSQMFLLQQLLSLVSVWLV